jgi:ABC-type bacteriocin/lantibiotic exporter with double-glycine peptidase domain
MGPTGSGKSTILDLIQGFIKPTSGRIVVNDIDLAKLDMQWWRSQFASVAQKTHLMQGTITDNIRFSNATARMEEVKEVATLAYADSFITELTNGYESQIDEVAKLSGGQMSRLALARAMMKKAPLLLMDEPTAQLDRESEEAIIAALSSYLQGRTAIFVIHRQAMLQLADHVIEIGGVTP